MDAPHFNRPGIEIKSRVTIWTPHLRAPGEFVYEGSTLGTRFGVAPNEGDGRLRVGVTLVTVLHQFVALVAICVLTQPTIKLLVEEPLAVAPGVRTLSHKFRNRRGGRIEGLVQLRRQTVQVSETLTLFQYVRVVFLQVGLTPRVRYLKDLVAIVQLKNLF